MDTGVSRRRGAALEAAILDAAWSVISEQGYAEMTLDAVARRAGTSRPVLHRRWPSRVKLATAALARFYALNPVEIPDLGSVGADLRAALHGMSDRLRSDLLRLVFDMAADLADANSNFLEMREAITSDHRIRAILERGVKRGEINPDLLTPRIVALPTDLVRHELLMTMKPLSDDAIREIVEDIFLPLVRSTRG